MTDEKATKQEETPEAELTNGVTDDLVILNERLGYPIAEEPAAEPKAKSTAKAEPKAEPKAVAKK